MDPMPNIFSRLLCAGLCLGGVTPAAVPTSGLLEAGPVAATTKPGGVTREAAAPVAEDPREWLNEHLSDVGAGAATRPSGGASPSPAQRDPVVAAPSRTWLPPVVVPAKPRAAAVKPQPLARIRPTADLPLFAADLTP